MSGGIRAPQPSGPQLPAPREEPIESASLPSPLIAPEVLASLGVESWLFPFLNQVEQSPDGSIPLSRGEAENLAGALDKVHPSQFTPFQYTQSRTTRSCPPSR